MNRILIYTLLYLTVSCSEIKYSLRSSTWSGLDSNDNYFELYFEIYQDSTLFGFYDDFIGESIGGIVATEQIENTGFLSKNLNISFLSNDEAYLINSQERIKIFNVLDSTELNLSFHNRKANFLSRKYENLNVSMDSLIITTSDY